MYASRNKWKLVFMSSFLITSSLYNRFMTGSDELDTYKSASDISFVSDIGYAIAGFLVGFGSRLGNGCTSGHGICGLARLSKRSLAAVITFMATGIATASLCPDDSVFRETPVGSMVSDDPSSAIGMSICAIFAGASLPVLLKKSMKGNVLDERESDLKPKEKENDSKKVLISAIAASIFSVGLAVSGMVKQHKVFGFLNVKGFSTGTWDGTLALVMGGGVVVSAIGYYWVKGFNYFPNERALSCPLLLDKSCGKFNIPTNTVIDLQLLLGSAIFGVGWGLGGLCPGPALFVAASGSPKVVYYWWPANLVGVFLAEQAKRLF